MAGTTPESAVGVVSATGVAEVDGLLVGTRWGEALLTYAFPDERSDYEAAYAGKASFPYADVKAISAAQQQAVRWILEGAAPAGTGPVFRYGSIESLTLLSFAESADDSGDMRIAQSSTPPTALGYFPRATSKSDDTATPASGDVWFGTKHDYTDPRPGNFDWRGHLHEIGHALGLKHPHETLKTGGFPKLPGEVDGHEFTVMSYRSVAGAPLGLKNRADSHPQTYMMLDIAALQHLYGANYETYAGPTTYRWNPETGEMSIDGVRQGRPLGNKVFLTIWDGDGNDTYDLSNYDTAVNLDLRPGRWSITSEAQRAVLDKSAPDTSLARGTVFNARLVDGDTRSWIENAVGGGGDDTLLGNGAANRLDGRKGADALSGVTGDDTLWGGGGHDTLQGGQGKDVLHGGTENDSLAGDAEDDVLFGDSGDDTLLGGPDDDLLEGGTGNDLLDGGRGDDILRGGDGRDTYVVDSTADSVVELPGEGEDLVRSAVDWTLGPEVERLTLLGRANLRGTGNAGDNLLRGNAGDNRLDGGDGNDVLIGGGGDDVLTDPDGASFRGGAGEDRFVPTGTGTLAAFPIYQAEDFVPGEDLVDLSAYTGLETLIVDVGTELTQDELDVLNAGDYIYIARGDPSAQPAQPLPVPISLPDIGMLTVVSLWIGDPFDLENGQMMIMLIPGVELGAGDFLFA